MLILYMNTFILNRLLQCDSFSINAKLRHVFIIHFISHLTSCMGVSRDVRSVRCRTSCMKLHFEVLWFNGCWLAIGRRELIDNVWCVQWVSMCCYALLRLDNITKRFDIFLWFDSWSFRNYLSMEIRGHISIKLFIILISILQTTVWLLLFIFFIINLPWKAWISFSTQISIIGAYCSLMSIIGANSSSIIFKTLILLVILLDHNLWFLHWYMLFRLS